MLSAYDKRSTPAAQTVTSIGFEGTEAKLTESKRRASAETTLEGHQEADEVARSTRSGDVSEVNAVSSQRKAVMEPKQSRPQVGPDSPLSILVADAEPMIQRVLRSAFERRGWAVSTVSNGREAMQEFDKQTFDLVVFDLNLPFKNGFELLEDLGGEASVRRPHMIVLSAEKQHESVLRAFELGADDFVSKPVNPDILVARIVRLKR
jgi:PleD family two-component response regulator